MYIFSVDFGTSSLKSAIIDEDMNIIATAKKDYELKVTEGDKVELDPEQIFKSFVKAAQELNKYMNDVEIIAFDHLSPSVMFLDDEGNPLYPIITHLDRRSLKQTQEIVSKMGEDEFQKITGVLPFAGGVSITSILWIKENLPEIFKKSYKIGHFNTYFCKKLTGKWAIDPVNASMMGLYETITESGWSKEITSIFGIPVEKLPEIMPAGTILGGLCREVSNLTGLKEGIPVILGSNDAATAQIGANNVNAGDVLNISGSSEILSIITDKPILNKKYYIRKAINPGKWQVFAIVTGGFAIEWFRKEFCREMDINEYYNEYIPNLIKNRAKKEEVEFLPYLTGDRHSLEKKRGGFIGLTLDTTREDLLLSILYGIHNPLIEVFKLAGEFLTLNKTIKITGGLTKDDSIIHLKEKIFKGFNFEIVNDCPLIGAAKLAMNSLKGN
ncbi:xylulokinase [Caldanaerovirga acetigignens]|uniref:Xylulokinase n=1 Tax=Caldanaerovirga acetigignens TaxID=447595 RepID=A0A1M7HA03_9FIRM|nr:FGGY family carbohydrate kinase [Caldanaerovirga acetigignens]SHM25258.1 xylulokinase [Caldanaerovirga acetigignens]